MAPSAPKKERQSVQPDSKMTKERAMQLKGALIVYAKKSNDAIKASIAAEKAKIMEERVPAFPDVDSLDEEALKQLCRDLHAMCDRTDEQLYDLEFKHTKSAKEEDELQKRISDIKSKFQKPALKRVKMSVSQMLSNILGKGSKQVDMRQQMKKN